MKYISFLCLCLLIGCNSLKQEVDPGGLSSEPEKIVVACFISPQDTVLAARISQSTTVLGIDNRGTPDITNAVVTLSDGTRSVSMVKTVNKLAGYTYYRATPAQLPVVVGKTYTLTVSVPNRQQVNASCTVPGSVAPGSIVVDSALTTNFGFSRIEYYARLRWRDPAGQVNYYRVAGQNEYTYSRTVGTSSNGPVRDSLIKSQGNWSFNNGSVITDLGKDGQEMVSPRGRLVDIYQYGRPQSSRLIAYLLNV